VLAALAALLAASAALTPAPYVEVAVPAHPAPISEAPLLATELPMPSAAMPQAPTESESEALSAAGEDGHMAPPELGEAQPLARAADLGVQAPAASGPTPIPTAESSAVASVLESPCDRQAPPPLPGQANPVGSQGFQSFRAPLPLTPRWNPPGPRRVGVQAGHWLNEQTPPELARLQHGSSGGGKAEWEVNLDIAQRAKRLLEAAGFEVDLLPTTVPPRYRAHVFVTVHADGDPAGALRGFKIARPGFSSVPEVDDRLVDELNAAYGPATGLPRDDEHISVRMRYYYAFNSRRYCHAVAPGVPQAIVETGFLTSAQDRVLLLGNPQAAARGIAEGIRAFLAH
jgi:N-acetylmuramoyl-L-alanine amidase